MDTLTPLQVKVLRVLAIAVQQQQKPHNKELAMLTGTSVRAIYRILESLENKKMISWRNHNVSNAKILKKGNDYLNNHAVFVEETSSKKTRVQCDKNDNIWVSVVILSVFGLLEAVWFVMWLSDFISKA